MVLATIVKISIVSKMFLTINITLLIYFLVLVQYSLDLGNFWGYQNWSAKIKVMICSKWDYFKM